MTTLSNLYSTYERILSLHANMGDELAYNIWGSNGPHFVAKFLHVDSNVLYFLNALDLSTRRKLLHTLDDDTWKALLIFQETFNRNIAVLLWGEYDCYHYIHKWTGCVGNVIKFLSMLDVMNLNRVFEWLYSNTQKIDGYIALKPVLKPYNQLQETSREEEYDDVEVDTVEVDTIAVPDDNTCDITCDEYYDSEYEY